MTATLDPRVGRAFSAAAGLAGDARERAVRDGCGGDAALEAEVRSLLAAHDGAGDFLQRPAAEPPPAPEVVADRYRIVHAIGSGSMGTVYLAEQLEPVRRPVALKLLRPGACSAEGLQRFELERRIVARLTHAGIARLLDSGTTADGRPWFAMEYVEGRAITAWCDERGLSFAARVQLAVDVCRAAQHAHANGVIHRDLKPGNVLVCEQDGRPVPRIIDFGVAKTSAALGVAPFQTLHGELVGTLEYMSPEQALGAAGGVDARTDVYALGAILHELVTGAPPLPVTEARRAGLEAVLRVLRETEPRRPSLQLEERARSEADPARRAALRASARRARGDFDRIVLTAVERDRPRRYATAADLADDLERFLRHEPVSVSPPTTLYQLAKFTRRHRTAVAGACAVLLALLAGLILALRQAREAERLRGLAVQGEQQAQHAAAETVAFASEMVGLTNAELANLAGGTRARLALAHSAFERLRALSERPGVETAVDTPLGYARQRLGEAETVAGRPVEALAWYEEALADRRRAVERTGAVFERRTLAVGHWRMSEARLALGELAEAEAHAREALQRLGQIDAEGGLVPLDHGVYLGMSRQHLAEALAAQDRGAEALVEFGLAERLLDEALVGEPAHVPLLRTRAVVLRGRAEVLLRAGRADAALADLHAALDTLEAQARRAGPANVWERAQQSLAFSGRATAWASLGRIAEAEADARRAVELARVLSEVDQDDFESHLLLGLTQSKLGALLAAAGRREEAVAVLAEAAALLERLARQSPRHAVARREEARACVRVAGLLGAARAEPALDWPRRARDVSESLLADGLLQPVDDDLRAWLADATRPAEHDTR